MQNTINDLQQKVNNNLNKNDNESNITNSENLVTELKLGSYQVTEHIEDEVGIGYSEENIIFEFEIIGKDEIKLVNVINNSNNTYNDIALKSGMTYKLPDANIKVLIDND